MLLRRLCIVAGILLLAAHGRVLTQAPTDFNGRWHPSPEIQPADPSWAPGPDLLIIQRPDALTVTALNAGRRQSTFRLDGSPAEGVGANGQRVITTATWDQSILVVVATDASSRTTTSYARETQGRLVVTSTTSLLHPTGGALTVSSIGPTRRIYTQVGSASAVAQLPREFRVGFRYDDSRVLFYTDTRQDPLKQADTCCRSHRTASPRFVRLHQAASRRSARS